MKTPVQGLPRDYCVLYTRRVAVIYSTVMKRLKLAFTLLLVSVLSLIGYSVYDNADLIAREKPRRDVDKPKSDFVLQSPRFVEMYGEQKVMEIDADEALYSRRDGDAELKVLKAVVYDREGKQTQLSGDAGHVDTDTNNFEIIGRVNILTSRGMKIETTALAYDNGRRLVTSKSPVSMKGEGFFLKGIGFRADVETNRYRILSRVEAVLNVRSGTLFVEMPL